MKKTKSIAGAIFVDTAYCSRTTDELLKILGGTPQGLSTEIAHQRLLEVGRNTLEIQKQVSAFGLFLNQFKSPIVLILLFATFVILLWVMKAGEVSFHTGWFIESVLSAALVVFAVRTRLPFVRRKPSRAMLGMTLLVGTIAIALPQTPLAGLLDFTPLPPIYLLKKPSPVYKLGKNSHSSLE